METTQERVVALINEAQLVSKDKKLECLNQVNELILHKDPSLLDSFFEEVVAFQQDTSVDVRKLVIGFIENACKRDSYLMTPSLPKLRYLLINDFNVNILKRVIICCIQLYKIGLAVSGWGPSLLWLPCVYVCVAFGEDEDCR
jgi:symplekin